MALSQKELSSTLKHLKRTPAPKAPVGNQLHSPEGFGAINLSSIKLKKTGNRESLIEADIMPPDYGKENSSNELNSAFKKRLQMFEQSGEPSEKRVTLPRVQPKPRRISEDGTDIPTKPRSESFHGDENRDNNGNVVEGTPTLKPLPTLQSIGSKPPPKPPKPQILSMKIQNNYKNHKCIIAPKVQAVLVEDVNNGSFDQDSNSIEEGQDNSFIEEGEDIYDDINTGIAEPLAEPVQSEPEPIEEDVYDDVEQLAETVKAELGQSIQHQPWSPTGHGQGIEGLNIENVDGDFGEDFYQPVEGTYAFEQTNGLEEDMDMPDDQDTPIQPPPLPRESKEDAKTKKEREKKEKESQKKKEKDEQRKKKEEERREREDKKKKEEERRRREKGDKDLKKAHKLKGSEPVLCKATAKEDIAGNGKDLPCSKGSTLEVIIKENCPSGKWLVKDQQGHYGYVSSDLLLVEVIQGSSVEPENLDEDLYECVDTFQSNTQPAAPPVSTDDFTEELYDDTIGVVDEDFYDDIPGANY